MCGIAGAVWNDASKAVEREALQRMIDVLRHRGPDDEGMYFSSQGPGIGGRESAALTPGPSPASWRGELDGQPLQRPVGVALGHRRLSIIDVAGGHQPLSNEDGSVWTVFNGEIYNFRELRRRLEQGGHRFRTRCDTEVLVHLYEDEGAEMLGSLRGMFALAVWDARRRRLLLARDRLGQKPLVYRREPGRLLFASELKSLLEAPGATREINPDAVNDYLTYQYVPHPRTIFRGVAKLPPGHLALYENERLEVRPYWQADFNEEERLPAAEYADRLRELMTAAVEMRLQSEVPLGAFLSGGIDSTIVVGLMSRLMKEPVRTFSIGFPISEFDETDYARAAAERCGSLHREFQVRPDAMEVLPRLVWHYDEPFADSSAVPTWYVSQFTRREVTVALSGDGGDELFLGYPRYLAVWLAGAFDRMPGLLRRMSAGRYWQKLPGGARQKSLRRRFKRFVEMLDMPPARRYLEWIAIFGQSRRDALYSDGFAARLSGDDPLEFLEAALSKANERDPLTAFGLADLVTYLPCDLMTKTDIASMAHGLECRQPFLDHLVVELAARMPRRLKFRGGRGKMVLRKAFGDLLPESIRRRSKMGFGVPLDHWFRRELRDFAREILLDEKTLHRGYFRPAAVAELWDEHQQGRFNHGYRLWSLLILELWQREWCDK
ncbi:MAG: asparagine synthase (glutamine-hydrolyzing) [Pirellulales bacterium]|nr:asparagine synthase (glutamine-hydrolyzing) [Pirellulales bacterium]